MKINLLDILSSTTKESMTKDANPDGSSPSSLKVVNYELYADLELPGYYE